MSQLVNDKAVCGTAPTTQGVLKKVLLTNASLPVVTLYSRVWSSTVYSAPSPPHERLQLELDIKSCRNSKSNMLPTPEI